MTELPPSRVLYERERIARAIDDLAGKLNERCRHGEWVVLCVMNGGLVFSSELMLRLDVTVRLDFVRVFRYRDTTSGGRLEWRAKPETDLEGKQVLLLDDIFDEGSTLAAIEDFCRQQRTADLVTAVLVEKLHDRKAGDFKPDLVGLTCPDAYVFGFGMDYHGLWRNLPEIRQLSDQ